MANDIIKLVEAREDIYAWLSAIMYLPQEDVLKKEFIDTLGDALQKISFKGLEEELNNLYKIIEDKGFSLTDMKVDFAKLTIGPGPLLAPPYESYYRDNKRVMGDSTLAVKKEYAASKMELAEDFKDLPDHIAVELNYLSYLCSYEKQAREEGLERETKALVEKEKQFLENHLLTWLDKFTDNLEKNARLPYYQNVARILNTLVKADYEIVKDLD